MKCEGEAICNNVAAPGHVYVLLASLGQLSAAFGIRWLVYIAVLNYVYPLQGNVFSQFYFQTLGSRSELYVYFLTCFMWMGGLGRFPWKQTKIRGN